MYEYNLGLRFQRIAAQFAARIALWFDSNQAMQYGQLDRLTNQCSRWLVDSGIKRQDVVCISGEKSLATFASMIACLKIGAIYCMLDPQSPPERLRKILTTCAPKLVLADMGLLRRARDLTEQLQIPAIELAEGGFIERMRTFSDEDLESTREIIATDPAYIMFTSGSTGFPKGAVMTHGNVLNLIGWARETYSIVPDDVLTNVNPLYFDNSVFDFYAALFNGAQLVPFSKAEVSDPKTVVDKVEAARCSLWFSVPSLLIFLQTMRATDGKNLRSICRFIFGGEGYPKAKLKHLYDKYSGSSRFFNVYGPTECTCICSSYEVTEKDLQDLQGLPPLGHIAKNFSYLILSDADQPVAAGGTGELCLLGPNIGRGYYNDPERTGKCFVQNPLHNKFVDIMYRTGDLARLNPVDGKLYIEGRKDNQIKHMGYRIELEEIEAALHCLDYISEAAALHSNADGFRIGRAHV